MKKNKILVGVISIMFAGIITLGIIECNNSNTKDNDKLLMLTNNLIWNIL